MTDRGSINLHPLHNEGPLTEAERRTNLRLQRLSAGPFITMASCSRSISFSPVAYDLARHRFGAHLAVPDPHSVMWSGLYPVRVAVYYNSIHASVHATVAPVQMTSQAGCYWRSQASVLGKIVDVCVKLESPYKPVHRGKGYGVGFRRRG